MITWFEGQTARRIRYDDGDINLINATTHTLIIIELNLFFQYISMKKNPFIIHWSHDGLIYQYISISMIKWMNHKTITKTTSLSFFHSFIELFFTKTKTDHTLCYMCHFSEIIIYHRNMQAIRTFQHIHTHIRRYGNQISKNGNLKTMIK